MSPRHEESSPLPIFEIDQPEIFERFLVKENSEILAYLGALQGQQSIVTIYLDHGQSFFLSSILTVDEKQQRFFVDATNVADCGQMPGSVKTITLTANLDKVKIQARLAAPETLATDDSSALSFAIPTSILRLQRREYFRLETPAAGSLNCQLVANSNDGTIRILDLPLADISGGGLSLLADPTQLEAFPLGSIFPNCRLGIPGEGALSINLCIREVIASNGLDDPPKLRIGCEFCNLPPPRRSQIQRYITRLERQRKARDVGLI